MNDSALAQALEAAHHLELEPTTLPRRAPARQEQPAPRGWLYVLWLRLFGPPAIDPRCDGHHIAVFRAFSEVGSDYLPSSGTWPSPTSDRS